MKFKERREKILKRLEKRYKNISGYSEFIGPGMKKKVQRLLFYPSIYTSFLKWKLGAYFGEYTRVPFVTSYNVEVNTNNEGVPPFYLTGILPSKSEYKLTKFFIKNFNENDVFYDVGANYGFYTYLALEFCDQVHSFEPLPFIFNDLKHNLSNTDNVFLNELALSDSKGSASLYLSDSIHKGNSTMKSDILDISVNSIKVKTDTLDNYINKKNKPTVLKIDVEGAEKMVIDGGQNFFKNNSPVIAMEVWSKDKGKDISMKAVNRLRYFGYEPYRIDKNGNLEKLEGSLPQLVESEFDNLIFKKEK